jgi:NADPH:quinone reductase-like Zn-dependent oxidoreductase
LEIGVSFTQDGHKASVYQLSHSDFGFGIPELPYIAGRDFVGTVVQESQSASRFKRGDVVFAASTDYRDLRKSAYQQFTVASNFNISRVPTIVSRERLAGIGVAFVAASLALGISLSFDFTAVRQSVRGPNLRQLLRSLDPKSIPADQRNECIQKIKDADIPKAGDWILIWGGSSTSAHIIAQLSKLIGLRVIKVVDVGKHGDRLSRRHIDLLIDGHDSSRATEIIRSVTKGNLRFAVDTIGKKTAELAQSCLQQGSDSTRSHLVGLSGLPEVATLGVQHHQLPIKVYHEVPEVGDSLMIWLEALLKEGKLSPPDTEVASGGLEGINDGLDRMRKGEISGKRLVIKL